METYFHTSVCLDAISLHVVMVNILFVPYMYEFHRIIELFGVEEILKVIYSNLPATKRDIFD